MLSRLFPQQFDARYRGHWSGLVILGLLIALRALIGFNSVFHTRMVASGPDGIPLDSFSPKAAAAVLDLFAAQGVSALWPVLLGLAALIRYRAMVPFVFLLLLVIQLAGQIRALAQASAPLAASGDVVVLALAGLTLLGLVLSLTGGSK